MPLSRTLKRGYKALTLPVRPLGAASHAIGEEVQNLQPAVNMLADQVLDNPAVTGIAQEAGGEIGGALGSAAGTGISALADMLGAFAPQGGGLAGSTLGGAVGEGVSDAISGAAAAVPVVGAALAPAAKAATGWMAPVGGSLGGLAGSAAGQAVGGLLSAAGKAAPMVGQTLGRAAAVPLAKVGTRMAGQAVSRGLHGLGTLLGSDSDSPRTDSAMRAMTSAMSTPMATFQNMPYKTVQPSSQTSTMQPPDAMPDPMQTPQLAQETGLRGQETPAPAEIGKLSVSDAKFNKPSRDQSMSPVLSRAKREIERGAPAALPAGPSMDADRLAHALSGATASGAIDEAEARRRMAMDPVGSTGYRRRGY